MRSGRASTVHRSADEISRRTRVALPLFFVYDRWGSHLLPHWYVLSMFRIPAHLIATLGLACLGPATWLAAGGCSRVGLSDQPGQDGGDVSIADTGVTVDGSVSDGSCREGEETFDGCNTCRCEGGEFVCTRLFCPDVGPDSDEEPDISVDQCLQECRVDSPPPEFEICATDGALYPSTCEIGCRGLQVADDPGLCASCEVPPSWEPIDFELVTIPDDCRAIADFAFSIDSAEFLDSVFECELAPLSERLEFDPSSEALFYVRTFGEPEPVRVEVYREGDQVWVYWVERVWCGGMAPPPSFFLARVPGADPGAIISQSCSIGICEGPPPP